MSQVETDISLTQIKIHTAFTISDGTNSSAFATTDAVYTPATFAAKLTTDLGYTVTAGGDLTTTDTTPYYRLYLQFPNAVTLTGMPKYIFNIPFSDFSVKAGGQVNLRNVNLDADMTIATLKSLIPQLQIGEDIDPISNSGTHGFSVSINKDGTIISIGDNTYDSNKGRILVYKYKIPTTTEWSTTDIVMKGTDPSQVTGKFYWTQYGSDIIGASNGVAAGEGKLNDSGNIIAVASIKENNNDGELKVYEYINDDWSQVGSTINAPNDEGNPKYGAGNALRINSDGTIVAWASKISGVNRARAYQYNGTTWNQLGSYMTGVGNTNGYSSQAFAMNNSGYIIAAGAMYTDSHKGEVFVYEYSNGSWTTIGHILGTQANGFFGQTVQLNAAGDILAVGAQIDDTGNTRGMVKVYQYTGSGTTWNEIGYIQGDNSGDKFGRTVSLNPSGTILIAASRDYSNDKGLVRAYQYTGSGTTWNQTGSDILGDDDDDEFGFLIETRGSKIIASNYIYSNPVYKARVYQLEESAISHTSTIPAGNHFINNFVNKLDTDISSYSLLYDEPNKSITFDGLPHDISMSITSTDTTVFDTSITEITTAANTLPFITYGQPDPTIKNYNDNGITPSEFISNGYTFLQLLSGSVIPDWNFVTDANHFDQSYLKGFTDVSGSVIIRNDNRLITNGDLSLGGNLITSGTTSLVIDDMTLKSQLLMGEDISANGKVYIGGDLSVNGQFSGDFANNIIPQSAIIFNPINISGNAIFTDDVSFNGPTVDISNTLKVNQIEFNDGTTVSRHDDNILSGTFADSNVVFKDSTFKAITCEGTATAATVTQSSDYRIKENVTELNETDTVDALVPIQYNNTLSGNHEFGLLAHELQEIYPDLVNGEKDGNEYQQVHYNGLIGVLVKEVQDIKQRLVILNNR